jgi:SAM-dependent methyltransferase
VLDVAAGDGNLALAAARAGAEVVAGDLNPASVERGKERARMAGLEIDWGVADAEALPYADASFDLVASNFGVIHAEDPRGVMDELERVVRPEGVVGITAWTSSGPMARILRLAAEREGAARAGARPERWGRYETAFLHFSRFDEFEMLDATLSVTFADEDELWAVLSDPPGPLARVIATGSGADDVRRHVVELLAGHRRELTSGLRLDLPYVILLGRRQPPSTQHALDRPETN